MLNKNLKSSCLKLIKIFVCKWQWCYVSNGAMLEMVLSGNGAKWQWCYVAIVLLVKEMLLLKIVNWSDSLCRFRFVL